MPIKNKNQKERKKDEKDYNSFDYDRCCIDSDGRSYRLRG